MPVLCLWGNLVAKPGLGFGHIYQNKGIDANRNVFFPLFVLEKSEC